MIDWFVEFIQDSVIFFFFTFIFLFLNSSHFEQTQTHTRTPKVDVSVASFYGTQFTASLFHSFRRPQRIQNHSIVNLLLLLFICHDLSLWSHIFPELRIRDFAFLTMKNPQSDKFSNRR